MILSRNYISWLLVGLALMALVLAGCSNSDDSSGAAATVEVAESLATATAVPATPAPTATPEPEPVAVVTTTNIVADWVRNVGGEHVDVTSLVPLGGDPHQFHPGPKDVARVSEAALVFSIGLTLEGAWLTDLIGNVAGDTTEVVELGEYVDPIEISDHQADDHDDHEGHDDEDEHGHAMEDDHADHDDHEGHDDEDEHDHAMEDDHADHDDHEGHDDEDEHGHAMEDDHADHDDHEGHDDEDEHGHAMEDDHADHDDHEGHDDEDEHGHAMEGGDDHHGHAHGSEDPHFWFDPIRVKIAVAEIAARLSEIDPDRAETFASNAAAYSAKLDELHAWTEAEVAAVPADRRLLVTSHDSLAYFAKLYDFKVVGAIMGVTTEVEPSAEDIVRLVDRVRLYEVPAVFGETILSERVAKALAEEAGVGFFTLYSGSLGGPGSGASTYIDMVRANVTQIVAALK